MFLGIDIGSSSSKAVAVNGHGVVLGRHVVNIGTGTNGVELALAELWKQTGRADAFCELLIDCELAERMV